MSDEKKATDQTEDPDLDELLDSALKDFDKPAKTGSKKDNDPIASQSSEALESTVKDETKEDVTVEEVWTEDFIKQAADQFQRNLEELMQNGSNNELGESFKKMAQTVAGALSDNNAEESGPDFQSAISQALKDLSATSENLQNVPNISEADLAAMFRQTSLEEGGTDFLPFMQGMMQSLFSKDVLYPSLKDLVDKYPAWLNEKRATLPPLDVAKYEKQFDLMQKVCQELENEKEDDSEEVKKKRFENTLSLMQEMQTCGPPPNDLIGEQQPLFNLDAEGNLAPPALPGMDESVNCSVM